MLLRGQIVLGRRNHVLAQVEVRGSFPEIRSDYLKLSCALAFFESVDACLPEGDPHPETFDLAYRFLNQLAGSDGPAAALVWADLHLLEQLGFGMNWRAEGESKEVAISPSAGGVVSLTRERAPDAVRVSREALEYLANVQESPHFVPSPVALHCIPVLHRVWEAVADRPLRARAALVAWSETAL
jgi:DNA repair protein RecO